MDKSNFSGVALWESHTEFMPAIPGQGNQPKSWQLDLLDQANTTARGAEGVTPYWELNITGRQPIDEEDYLSGYPYPSLYPWWHIIIASIIVTIIIIVIILGNALVIMAIAKDNNLKGLQNWFIASLAVSDLLLGALIMPFSLANELMGYWMFGTTLCQMWLSIDVLLCTASILNLCLISLDRYWSITRAVSYVRNRTRKRAIIMITTVWVLSGIICFPPLVGWKRPQSTKLGYPLCLLSQEKGYVVYSTLGSFYIPLIVMVVVYFKIYLAARERARRNLKKKQIVPPHGGKQSTSTSSNTKDNQSPKNKMTFDKLKAISDTECTMLEKASSNESPMVSDSCNEASGGIKMTRVNNKGNIKSIVKGMGERRQLLCEDTDLTESELPGVVPSKTTEADDSELAGYKHSAPEAANEKLTQCGTVKSPHADGSNGIPVENIAHRRQEVIDDNDNAVNNNAATDQARPHFNIDRDIKSPSPDFGEIGSPDSKKDLLSPNNNPIRGFRITGAKSKKRPKDRKALDDPDRMRRKIARAKERRATIVLGVIMATFILCWLPFFSTYLISTLAKLNIPEVAFAVMFWAGYFNSALNPIIYTIFNRDFRLAFQRIMFGRRWGNYY